MYFKSTKISLRTFIERLSNDLVSYIKSKRFVKSFCSDIKREIRKIIKGSVPTKKIPLNIKKNCTPLFKENSKFYITNSMVNSLQNEGIRLEYLILEKLVMELKNCKIVDKKSLTNLIKLRLLKLSNNFRFHEYRFCFSGLDIDLIDIINLINRNGTIRDKNITIWLKNHQNLVVSISSKGDKGLSNLELLSVGFEQIAKRLPINEVLILFSKMKEKMLGVELGVSIETELKEIMKNFKLYPYTYKIYKLKYWINSSYKGRELDLRFNCTLNDVFRAIKLIELFNNYVDLLKKGIEIIKPFSLENTNIKNNSSKKARRCYKAREIVRLVKCFIIKYISRVPRGT